MEVSLNELKKQADDLGITYSPNIGEATLLEKIQKAKIAKGIIDARAKAKDEKKELTKLLHVQITNLNDKESDVPAKFFEIGNREMHLRKAIQFDTPIFLEKWVVDYLKNQKFVKMPDTANAARRGKPVSNEPRLLPAYSIEYLEDITPEKLEEMKKDKQMRDATIKEK